MEYRVDREALGDFIARQVALVEAAPLPRLLADVVELRMRHESVSRDEVRALWLGAWASPRLPGESPPAPSPTRSSSSTRR